MSTRQYRILPGYTFRDGDSILSGGDTIELPLDMVALHRHKIEPLPDQAAPVASAAPVVQTSAPAPADPAEA